MKFQTTIMVNETIFKYAIAFATLALFTVVNQLQAETVYIDFGNTAGPIVEPESYNEIVPSAGGPNTSLSQPDGEDFTGLVDTNNTATGIDLNLMVTSNIGAAPAGHGSYIHNPISGITSNALNDGLWLNNGGKSQNEFGFRVTFTDLPSERYDINLTANEDVTINNDWYITTGIGDSSTNLITGANDISAIVDWRNVAPVDGMIVIQSRAKTTTTAFKDQRLGFISLTSVPTVLIGWHSPNAVPDTTPDMGLDGVTGLLSGGNGLRTDANSTDNNYGSEPGTPLNAANSIRVITGGNYELFLSVTNNTEKHLVLEILHFDYGRWWPNSPQDVALYYDSGDLSATTNTLINSFTGTTPLNGKSGDYDDFDCALKAALGDITLTSGEGATFRLVASNSNEGSTSSAFDNIAISGYLSYSKGTSIIVK
jgi:hypothetical protein